jgi:hypothetical protein
MAASGGIGRELHRLTTSGADDIGCGTGGRHKYRLCRTTDITDYHQHLRLRWCKCHTIRKELTARSCSQTSCNGCYTGITQAGWHLQA